MSDSVPTATAGVQATDPQTAASSTEPVEKTTQQERRLRVWPGVVIVVAQWLLAQIASWVAPGTMIQFYAMFMGPMVAGAAFVAWWIFASRIPWRDRGLVLGAFVAIEVIASLFAHPTVNPMVMIVLILPVLMRVWAGWLLFTPFLSWPVRRAGLLAAFVLSCGYYTLLRLDGVSGSMATEFAYRWAPTSEEKFLAEGRAVAARRSSSSDAQSASSEPLSLAPGDWPGFRGPARDGKLPGVKIVTSWDQRPPRELWRHRVGPGWSSFAVVGHRLYTQEQRGAEEAVICYDAATGVELWVHGDNARFTETMAGPGPRATPTFHEGKIYALGAKGALNCLDAVSGGVIWSRDIVADSDAQIPIWGFSASPLIVNDVLTVFAGGPKEKSVLAYSASSGEPVWTAGEGQLSYCSTQLSQIAGVEQLVIATEKGLAAFDPAAGTVLWTYSWPLEGMARVVQPAIVGDSDLLIGTGFGMGTQRVRVTNGEDGWIAKEFWSNPTRAIRPYYNDLVVHGEYLYGFDNNFFTCVSLSDGKAKWKTRGYGNGQVLLLTDQDLLLILSETGEVALVDAKPEAHHEIAKFKAIEGKTWNHPVVAHGRLYVRNGEEAACYELTIEDERGSEL